MSYIDALYKKDEDKVYVVERNQKVDVFLQTILLDILFTILMHVESTKQ